MPRVARTDIGGYPYHIINRVVMRLPIFTTDVDYQRFEQLLFDTADSTVQKGTPWGRENWVERMADRFGLSTALRERGRPLPISF